MAVGLKTDPIFYMIGTGSFMHSFFSTIAYRLEGNKWGSKFPNLMNGLYNAEVEPDVSKWVLDELQIIKLELSRLTPDKVIWDIDNLTKRPPWGDNIAKTITDLSNYFVTSDGKQLLDVFEEALRASIDIKKPIKIQ
jgi:2,3-bisphosphoglycerate-dependent phosphoglycerate mutase